MRDPHSWVRVQYLARLAEDGRVFDDHNIQDTLYIELGTGSVPKPLEDAIMEMDLYESRNVLVTADEGFGHYDEEKVITRPITSVENANTLPIGGYIMWKGFNGPGAEPVLTKVVGVTDDEVIFDLNHPLAGFDVEYWIRLVEEGPLGEDAAAAAANPEA